MLERRGLAGRLSGYRGGHLDSGSGGDHRGKCPGAETPVALLRQAPDTDDVFHDVPSRNSALGRIATWYVVKYVVRIWSLSKKRDRRLSSRTFSTVIPARAGIQVPSSVSTQTTS